MSLTAAPATEPTVLMKAPEGAHFIGPLTPPAYNANGAGLKNEPVPSSKLRDKATALSIEGIPVGCFVMTVAMSAGVSATDQIVTWSSKPSNLRFVPLLKPQATFCPMERSRLRR